MASPIQWYGGKGRLAPFIQSIIPHHDMYVEVFGGGANVLLQLPPVKFMVYNDLDDGVVNFFTVLRDAHDRLVELLRLTPYARREYEYCRVEWRNYRCECVLFPFTTVCEHKLLMARAWWVANRQGFSGSGTHRMNSGWRFTNTPNIGSVPAMSTMGVVEELYVATQRLRIVQIDNLPWEKCVDRYDCADAVIYLDPPYLPETRTLSGHGYSHELTYEDHVSLLARACDIRGTVIISGYPSDLYDNALGGWDRYVIEVPLSSAKTKGGAKREVRQEVLWRRLGPKHKMQTFFTMDGGIDVGNPSRL